MKKTIFLKDTVLSAGGRRGFFRGALLGLAAAVALYFIVGAGCNLILRTISYSCFSRAKPYANLSDALTPLSIGENGDLTGYAFLPPKANKTVLYFGGSGEIACNAVTNFIPLAPDAAIYSVDYPGSQQSAGRMSADSILDAALRLYDRAAAMNGDEIFIAGYSFGTGVATYLASQRPCAGLILLAPYGDMYDVYNQMLPVFYGSFRRFLTDNIDAKRYAAEVDAPTLIVTSDADKTLPQKIALSLARKFPRAETAVLSGLPHRGFRQSPEVTALITAFTARDS